MTGHKPAVGNNTKNATPPKGVSESFGDGVSQGITINELIKEITMHLFVSNYGLVAWVLRGELDPASLDDALFFVGTGLVGQTLDQYFKEYGCPSVGSEASALEIRWAGLQSALRRAKEDGRVQDKYEAAQHGGDVFLLRRFLKRHELPSHWVGRYFEYSGRSLTYPELLDRWHAATEDVREQVALRIDQGDTPIFQPGDLLENSSGGAVIRSASGVVKRTMTTAQGEKLLRRLLR